MNYASEIARLDQIIADAEALITRQRLLIEMMRTVGLATEDAEKSLGTIEDALKTLHWHRGILVRAWKSTMH